MENFNNLLDSLFDLKVELKKDLSEIVDEVYKKYHDTVNMCFSELERWSKTECSKTASLDRSPIERNLKLLSTKKEDWGAYEVKAANRTISFVSRMKNMEQGPEQSMGCPSKRDVSLMNWAYNPNK